MVRFKLILESALIIINWGVLIFYVLATIINIIKKNSIKSGKGPLPALAIVYSAISAFYIGQSIVLFRYFCIVGQHYANIFINTPSPLIFSIVFICTCFITSAFLCNCSRSFFILNELEYGEFYVTKNWKNKIVGLRKYVEFIFRLICASCFLYLEIKMTDAAKYNKSFDKALPEIANAGLFLYIFLILWWFINRKILRIKIEKKYPILFVGGFSISLFMLIFGGKSNDLTLSSFFFLLIIVFFIAAILMIGIILYEVGKKIFFTVYNWRKPRFT